MKNILFNSPYASSLKNIEPLKKYNHFSSNGKFTKQCEQWLRDNIKCKEALLVHSCMAALEICAILLNIKKNGSIILVQSSKNAQNNINQERKVFKLKKIIAPFRNLFFSDRKIKKHFFKNVKIVNIHPFASDFYYVISLIYAKFSLKKKAIILSFAPKSSTQYINE